MRGAANADVVAIRFSVFAIEMKIKERLGKPSRSVQRRPLRRGGVVGSHSANQAPQLLQIERSNPHTNLS